MARLEGLADPGGIAISDAVRSAVRGRLSVACADLGEQQVKNIPHPVRVFRIQSEPLERASPSASDARPPIPSSRRPSIAVLPFKVLTEDASVGFLADGLAEDVSRRAAVQARRRLVVSAAIPGVVAICRRHGLLWVVKRLSAKGA
jgi:adenylate cyclase